MLVALHGSIHLEGAVVEFVHHGGDVDIERIAGRHCVARHIVHIELTENAQRVQLLYRVVLVGQSEGLALAVAHSLAPHDGAQRQFLSAIAIVVAAAAYAFIQHIGFFVAHRYVYISHIPGVARTLAEVGRRLYAELHIAGAHQRIGKVGRIGSRIKIIAVLTEQCLNTHLLIGKVHHTERVATMKQAVALGGAQKAVGRRHKVAIGHRVQSIEVAGSDMIVQLGLARILLRQHLV